MAQGGGAGSELTGLGKGLMSMDPFGQSLKGPPPPGAPHAKGFQDLGLNLSSPLMGDLFQPQYGPPGAGGIQINPQIANATANPLAQAFANLQSLTGAPQLY